MRRIIVQIEEEITETVEEQANCIIKETQTDKLFKGKYDDEAKPLTDKEYAIVTVEKVKTRTNLLLKQEIEDDSTFDLPTVIRAINGL